MEVENEEPSFERGRNMFIHVNGYESIYNSDFYNEKEATCVVEIVLYGLSKNIFKSNEIGIITPYLDQKKRIRMDLK